MSQKSAKRKGKRGRPKGSMAAKTRDDLIQIKVFPEEHRAYVEAAQSDGLTKSAWIRFQLNRVISGDSE